MGKSAEIRAQAIHRNGRGEERYVVSITQNRYGPGTHPDHERVTWRHWGDDRLHDCSGYSFAVWWTKGNRKYRPTPPRAGGPEADHGE